MATPTKLNGLLDNPKMPEFPKLDETPPANLPVIAQEEWKRMVPILIRPGIVTAADLSVFADYCRCFARVQKLESVIDHDGVIYTDKNDQERKSPTYSVFRSERDYLNSLRVQLGLTPYTRKKLEGLAAEKPQESNPWAEDYETR